MNGYDNSYSGGDYYDAFAAKFSPDLNALEASTFLGGSQFDHALALALDGNTNVYLTGWTDSPDFPIAGGYQSVKSFGSDVFVASLSPELNALQGSTFLGGYGLEQGNAVAIGPGTSVYVAGWTMSENFPIVGGYDSTWSDDDGFAARLNTNLSTLQASTFLGGSNKEGLYGLAVDRAGQVYVTGSSDSPDFPVVNGYSGALAGGTDVIVAKFNPTLNTLLASTFLGGAQNDVGLALALGSGTNVYLAGRTYSTNFPAAGGYQDTQGGAADAFAAMFDSTLGPGTGLTGPSIRVNGQAGTAVVAYPGQVTVSVAMNPGPYVNTPVDWWIVALVPPGNWYYLDSAMAVVPFNGDPAQCRPVYQGALYDLAPLPIFTSMGLPRGTYTLWFAVDYPMDGRLVLNGPILADSVTIRVQ